MLPAHFEFVQVIIKAPWHVDNVTAIAKGDHGASNRVREMVCNFLDRFASCGEEGPAVRKQHSLCNIGCVMRVSTARLHTSSAMPCDFATQW